MAVALGAMYVANRGGHARAEEAGTRQEMSARARIVAACDEERRRVVRDLHDGAQQRLVHATVVMTLALDALGDGDPRTRALLEDALHQTEQAVAELRELAHGILPSVLTHGGLEAALRALASRTTLPVTVDVPGRRFPRAIEATAYFVVSEALTNAVKHAAARNLSVSAGVSRGQLTVEVTDDGIGGAGAGWGTNGLAALDDRVAALGGRLIVHSPRGHGTRVVASMPLLGSD